MTRRWVLRGTAEPGMAEVERLCEPGLSVRSTDPPELSVRRTDAPELSVRGTDAPESLVERLLMARGLVDPEQIARFCEPKLMHLHDPATMPNVDRAAERLVDAVKGGELIYIYGDYDVDGITATAILHHTVRCAQPDARIRSYVPHRLEEGYGLNCDALRQLKAEGADLVISVDCGITAVESARTAREMGLDLIITDHHNLPHDEEGLPDAFALVHPRLPGSAYPFGELCGAGVAFKLAWRFATMWCGSERVSKSLQNTLVQMLPLAALGTIADVVPLVGENRIIASFGLQLIKQTQVAGLRALIEASRLMDQKIDCEQVGFRLAPRLNACGRMGHAADAVRLLTEATQQEAVQIAEQLNRLNQDRQNEERRTVEQAMELVRSAGMDQDDRRAIVLAHAQWHPGVLGIVCSRLVDRFTRPVVLMQDVEGVCKGSARSIPGYSIHAGLQHCAPHLTGFGGHDAAAGVQLESRRLAAFAEALIAHANEAIGVDQLVPSITIDCDATLHELDVATVDRVSAFSPFGQENPRPTIRVRSAVVAEAPQQIGANGKHLVIRVRQENNGQRNMLRTIWWNAGSRASDIAAGMRLDLAIEPKINEWNGRRSVEAHVRDVMICK